MHLKIKLRWDVVRIIRKDGLYMYFPLFISVSLEREDILEGFRFLSSYP